MSKRGMRVSAEFLNSCRINTANKIVLNGFSIRTKHIITLPTPPLLFFDLSNSHLLTRTVQHFQYNSHPRPIVEPCFADLLPNCQKANNCYCPSF
ncbi:hypothetical protein L3X38_008953 [Prunus dulcis]|uniref:Uncharacterized protein n=1 Tax=Prunus dulcis TaxID=3755 RepID=A0AAD5F7L7_PRUDU|nr:hypothetical protein L3X38_008953 [Prunus dulcis]